jgi:hypothetical protein
MKLIAASAALLAVTRVDGTFWNGTGTGIGIGTGTGTG